MSPERRIYQPIHPSIRDQLDPEYVRFHDDYLQYIKPSEQEPWDPTARSKPSPTSYGAQGVSRVGSTLDHDTGAFQVRIFTPEGDTPAGGWPALVWYHGGGFVVGGLESEKGFLTHVCRYVKCIVATINYRHAPEFKHPTAFTDSFNGLKWVLNNATKLSLNPSKVAMGGLSAGGCICAVTTLKAVSEGLRPLFQLLICPVLDNTATSQTTWAPSRYSPWLTPSRMSWYRSLYFSNPEEAHTWDASPALVPEEMMALSPSTFLAVAECDLLQPEAIMYSRKLLAAGVDTEVKVYPGATHSILILAGYYSSSEKTRLVTEYALTLAGRIHKISQQLVHDACSALAKAFGNDYNLDVSPILKAN